MKSLIWTHLNAQRAIWLDREHREMCKELGFNESTRKSLQKIAAREMPIREMN